MGVYSLLETITSRAVCQASLLNFFLDLSNKIKENISDWLIFFQFWEHLINGGFDQDLLYKGFHLLFMLGLCQLKHKPFIFLFL